MFLLLMKAQQERELFSACSFNKGEGQHSDVSIHPVLIFTPSLFTPSFAADKTYLDESAQPGLVGESVVTVTRNGQRIIG